jgi:hypothetical protein
VSALPRPDAAACLPCPWRQSNRGKRHPDGWYTKANLRRLWAGLRRGEAMSCHPTDPGNPVSERAAAAGYRPAPAQAAVRECVGAQVLVQREMHLAQHSSSLRAYRAARPGGLTKAGIAQTATRLIFGGTALSAAPRPPRPNLNDPDIGYEPLPWEPIRAGDA